MGKNINVCQKISRYFLSVIFILSGILKVVNVNAFASEIQHYFEFYIIIEQSVDYKVCGVLVCMFELTLGILSFDINYKRIVGFFLLLAISFFVYLTGLNLFFPTIMGSIESCGCFGELIHFTPTTSFIKSVVLWVLSLVLVIASYRNKDPWNITRLLCDKYLYICIAVSVVLPLYSLWFLNELSHAVYICGFVVLCIILMGIVTLAYRHTKTEI